MQPDAFLFTVTLIPIFLILFGLALVRRLWKPYQDDHFSFITVGAVGLAVVIGHIMLSVMGRGEHWTMEDLYITRDAGNAALWLGGVSTILAVLIASRNPWPAYVIWPLRVLGSLPVAYITLMYLPMTSEWSFIQWLPVTLISAGLITLNWWAIDMLSNKLDPRQLLLLLTGASFLIFLLIILSDSTRDAVRIRNLITIMPLLFLMSLYDKHLIKRAGLGVIFTLAPASFFISRYYTGGDAVHWAPFMVAAFVLPAALLVCFAWQKKSEKSLLQKAQWAAPIFTALIVALITMGSFAMTTGHHFATAANAGPINATDQTDTELFGYGYDEDESTFDPSLYGTVTNTENPYGSVNPYGPANSDNTANPYGPLTTQPASASNPYGRAE